MKLIKSKKGISFLLIIAVAAISAVGAFAYWTNSGSGTGSADTGDNAAIIVNQTSLSAGTLYPGGPTEALSGDFDNGNAGEVHVTTVTATVTGTSVVGCDEADFYITPAAPGANTQEVPSGNGEGSWSGLAVGMTNTAANQDLCKNASLTITYASV